jgi:hypothetical protein
MNLLHNLAEDLRASKMYAEAYMYESVANYLDEAGKEAALRSIDAHIEQCKHEAEAGLRLTMRGIYGIVNRMEIN